MALPLERDDHLPEPRRLFLTQSRPQVNFDAMMWRWQKALATYRGAVETYQSTLERTAQSRRLRGPRAHHAPHAPTPAARAHQTPLAQLTRREDEVAVLISRGFTNQQIAAELVITPGTAANHVAHVLAKLEAANRTQVAVLVQRRSATIV
ncbi:MAG: response regulator transcription factor [Chloroflexi bacterium]|nr:response regulator transcription factor [Chloroflexota bacterium]